jgi:hypothetical protein
MNNKHRDEMREQAKALSGMYGDELDLIAKYAKEMRTIMNEFELSLGRVPTADELIDILSEHHERDLRGE